ncbi:hypothetical protein STEG23_028209, partial [Scotinomys teguina]
MYRLTWFLDPGGFEPKTAVVGHHFIFPGIYATVILDPSEVFDVVENQIVIIFLSNGK